MFFERFISLCRQRGISPSEVCYSCGLSSALFSDWKKKGAKPQNRTIKKIADFFGVEPSYFTDDSGFVLEDKKEEAQAVSGLEASVLSVMAQMSEKEKAELLLAAYSIIEKRP